jgi:hypothetical protein
VVRDRVILETKADNKVMAKVKAADRARIMDKTAARATVREAVMVLREILISINISISTDMARAADRGDRAVSRAACRWRLKRLQRQESLRVIKIYFYIKIKNGNHRGCRCLI